MTPSHPHTASMPKQLTVEEANKLGYAPARILPSGECAGVSKMLFTVGLLVGLSDVYRTRFCYPTFVDACEALYAWDGEGDPPGPWVKEKGINKQSGRPVSRNREQFTRP